MKRVVDFEAAQRVFAAMILRQREGSKIEARSRRRLALFAWTALATLAYLGPWWLSFAFAIWLGWIGVRVKADHESWELLQSRSSFDLTSTKKESGKS